MRTPAPLGTSVVVGYDTSVHALEAVQFAADEADRRGLPLTIVHAFTWPWTQPEPVPGQEPPDPHARRRITRSLAQTAAELRVRFPHVSIHERIIDGAAGPVLVDRSQQAALLVVGHRGEGGLAGLLAGSVAIHAAGHAACPVVVVRGTSGKPEAPVVVGIDGSLRSHPALEFAADDAAWHGSPLTLVTVTPHGQPTAVPADEVAEVIARYPDLSITHHCVSGLGSPAGVLADLADGARLVVVGSQRASSLRGILLGSVGRRLIEHAPCPVAVVRRMPPALSPIT